MGVGTREPGSPDPREPALHVRLLGGLDLRLGEAPVPPLDSARAESLLAYLLLHRGAPQPRQRLAFLLWPDSTETQARTNLRHVLHNLRRALPDADRFIDVGPRTLQWRPQAPLWLDVAVFERAVAEDRLEEAVEVYAGDLLEGSYDDWLLDERQRLRQLHLDALERLARRLHDQGRWVDAIRYAERLLREDTLREESYRLLMRLHDARGDGARALRAYHVCAATLQRELGIEPSAATRETYEGLLAVAPEPGPPQRGPLSVAGPALVGRTPERARLTAIWRDAERGAAQLVLVSGEPGVGKTRLVEELRLWCAHRGAVTAEARAYPAEGAMAYGPVVTWLRCEPIAARLRRLDPRHLTELARLLPELLVEVPDVPAPPPLPESEQRRRLFDAVTRAICASGAPLLLVADDLQWCDVQTLRFLHYLLRAEPDARMLVAATARREEIDAGHAAGDLLAGLQALGRLSELALGRLSRQETGMLAQRIAGRRLPDADADRLYADSEGNPLFVVEALRADPEGAGAGMSPKVQAVIGARLAQLSEPAGDLVRLAATIGREFTAQVLADAGAADERTLVRGLDELWRRGLVRAHGPSAYDFSHGRIREAAYRALSPAQRRHNHLRVAQALQRAHAHDLDAVSGQIAAHYERAGEAGRSVAWHLRAADAAQRLHANADAVRALERALELTRGLPASGERAALELEVLTALPAPLVAVDGYLSKRMVEVHERAHALVAELGVEPEPPLLRSLALASLTRGDFDAAHVVGEQLRSRAKRDGDDVLWVESAYVLGVAAFWRGRLEPARSHFHDAVERYHPDQRSAHLLRYGQDPQIFCLMRLAYTLWLLGRDQDAGRALDAALSLAGQSGHPFTRATTVFWAALLALDQHDEQQLRGRIEAVLANPGADWQAAFAVETFGGHLEVLDGRPQDGLQRVQRAVAALSRRPAAPGVPGVLARILLETCAAAGDARAGLAAADEALGMGGGAQLWEAETRRLRAGFLSALGADPEGIEAELTRAIEVAERQRARAFERRAREDIDRFRAERAEER